MNRDHRLKNISFSQRLPIPTTFDQYEGSTSIHYVDVSQQWEQRSQRLMRVTQNSTEPPTVSTVECTDQLPNSLGMAQTKSLGPDRFIRTEGTSSWVWVACGWVKIEPSSSLPRIDLLTLSMGVWPVVPRVIKGTPSNTPAKPVVRYMENVLPIGHVYLASYASNFIPESRITEYGTHCSFY